MPGHRVSHDGGTLSARLGRLIAGGGPIPLSLYMAYANQHYYATRDPLGLDGDFTTAPEISQMFGELAGLWAADVMLRAPAGLLPAALVELGPGRGTLMADMLRAMAGVGLSPDVHLVETSPVLRDLQAAAVPQARFHDDVATLPDDRPLVIIANEFFDALPVRQLVRTVHGWRERLVGLDAAGGFAFVTGDVPMDAAVPAPLRAAMPGTILESSPASVAIMRGLADRLAAQGGVMLAVDYGYTATAHGDSLQALSKHAFADPLAAPGERDLTAHVDFSALAMVAREMGLSVQGPVTLGDFLRSLGLDARAAALSARHPDRAAALGAEAQRLSAADQMGQLFKVLAAAHPGWPRAEGFGA